DRETFLAPPDLHQLEPREEQVLLERVLKCGEAEERLVSALAQAIVPWSLFVADATWQVANAMDGVEDDRAIVHRRSDELATVRRERLKERIEGVEVEGEP